MSSPTEGSRPDKTTMTTNDQEILNDNYTRFVFELANQEYDGRIKDALYAIRSVSA